MLHTDFILCIKFYLSPFKGDESVNIDKCDSCRNYIFENRFHPRTHFHTDAHVGFFNEVIPTPAELVATEQSKHKRTERKNICGNNEVPKIKPCCTLCKRLKMKNAESESRCECKHKHYNSARIFSQTPKTVDIAANTINRKKSEPHILPPGILLNTVAIVSNKRFGPELTSRL